MVSKRLTKFKIVLMQNIYAFFIIGIWFGGHFLYFWSKYGNITEAWKIVFFFKDGSDEYSFFYSKSTEFIIFGLVFSLITVELFRKYNPEVTCRTLSRKLEDHFVIIGYSNIGKRIAKYLDEKGIPHVIIDKNLELIENLIENEEPVVHDDATSKKALIDAGIDKAKAVFVLADNLEVQMVVNYMIRQLNPKCLIVDRVFQDDIGDLISKTYNTTIISTSKYAANIIFENIQQKTCKNIVLIGMNHISERLIKKFKKISVNFKVIEECEEIIEESMIELTDPCLIMGDPKELSTMEKADIANIDCVVNLINDISNTVLITKRIRDLNPNCRILCRIFQDHLADMLEKPPFNCEIISSSKATVMALEKMGLFDF